MSKYNWEVGTVLLNKAAELVQVVNVHRAISGVYSRYPIEVLSESGEKYHLTLEGRYWKNYLTSSDKDISEVSLNELKERGKSMGTYYNQTTINCSSVPACFASTDNKFIVVDTNNRSLVGSYANLKEAKKEALKALKVDKSFIIFEAVTKISPKPIDADVEDL